MIHTPHLDLAVKAATENVFSSVRPVDAENPCRGAREIRDLLAVLDVEESDVFGVARGGKAGARW